LIEQPVKQRRARINEWDVITYAKDPLSIAKIGRCAVRTVKSRVNRARVKLAHLLGAESVDAFGPHVATEATIGRTENRR
jgi:hypothetical protein